MALVGQQERIWLAREIIRFVQKALKARKLYGPEHAHARSGAQELAGSLRTFTRLHGALRLGVTRATLDLGEEAVYEEADRNQNLAYRLFMGAVREIKVEGEPQDDEVERLLGVFAGALDDQDAASLFWGADFSTVELVCLNELAEGWDEPCDLSPGATEKIREMNAHADRLIESLKHKRIGGDGGLVYTVTDTGAELSTLDRVQLHAGVSDEDGDRPAFMALSRDQLDELRQEAAALGSAEVVLAVLDEVLRALEKEPLVLSVSDGVAFVEETPASALRRNDVALLASIVERYASLRGEVTGELEAAIDRVLASIPTPERIERLVKAVSSGALGGPGALCRVFATLGELGAFAAVEAYLAAKTKELREALLELLGRVGPEFPDALGRLLHPGVDADTAKWALFLVNRTLHGQAAERLYLAAINHPVPAVSRYASFLFRTQTEKGRRTAFHESLDATDESERIRALDAVVKSRDFASFEALKAVVDAPGFLGRSAEERRAFLSAVAEIGGKGALGFVARQTERRTTNVLRLRAAQEVRSTAEELVAWLRELPEKERPEPERPAPVKPDSLGWLDKAKPSEAVDRLTQSLVAGHSLVDLAKPLPELDEPWWAKSSDKPVRPATPAPRARHRNTPWWERTA